MSKKKNNFTQKVQIFPAVATVVSFRVKEKMNWAATAFTARVRPVDV